MVGYWYLDPNDNDAGLTIEIYKRMSVLPTLICKDRRKLTLDDPIVRKTIEWAEGR